MHDEQQPSGSLEWTPEKRARQAELQSASWTQQRRDDQRARNSVMFGPGGAHARTAEQNAEKAEWARQQHRDGEGPHKHKRNVWRLKGVKEGDIKEVPAGSGLTLYHNLCGTSFEECFKYKGSWILRKTCAVCPKAVEQMRQADIGRTLAEAKVKRSTTQKWIKTLGCVRDGIVRKDMQKKYGIPGLVEPAHDWWMKELEKTK